MKTSKTKKYKLNFKKLIILVLFVYLLGFGGFYIINRPIRNIIIEGNNNITEIEIIRAAQIEDYPSIFRLNTNTLKDRIKELELINDVQINRDRHFRLTINVDEAKVVFYNSTNNKLMLSNGYYIENNHQFIGIPTLINFAPEAILKEFAAKLGRVDLGVLSLISEIEYSPMIGIDGSTIDETRFILYMNDGNIVYTNVVRAINLNFYTRIFASLEGQSGVIYLDSANNFIFRDFESLENNEEDE